LIRRTWLTPPTVRVFNWSRSSGVSSTMYRTFIPSASKCWSAGDHAPAEKSIPPMNFTEKQGQYLAFIYAYTKLHRRPPAEADMQVYFGTTPPSVHRMVVELETKGLISRRAGQARSIELLVAPEGLPILR
jgi:DNA-binding MarR family transcriptional regulator